jgi:uncharacterized protein YsxB (DUF464 family)
MNTTAAKTQRIPPTRISQDGFQQLLHNQIRQAVRITVVAEPDAENVCVGHVMTGHAAIAASGADAVLDAVRKCLASLWTARAIGYRLQHKIDQDAVSLAVVVQLLVPAEASGILFTANPVNGQRDQTIITATWGVGASGSQLGLLTATAALMQFIFALVWGAVSDCVGRKPILALGVLGYAIALLLFGLATQLWMLCRIATAYSAQPKRRAIC